MVWCSSLQHISCLGLPHMVRILNHFSLSSFDLSCSTWFQFSSCSCLCSWFSWAYSSYSKEENSSRHSHYFGEVHMHSFRVMLYRRTIQLHSVANYSIFFASYFSKRKIFPLRIACISYSCLSWGGGFPWGFSLFPRFSKQHFLILLYCNGWLLALFLGPIVVQVRIKWGYRIYNPPLSIISLLDYIFLN